MNGVHDLGGVDGMGPVKTEQDEPVFRAEWEKAAFAMFAPMARAGIMGLDQFRFGIEQMPPGEYLLGNYYEHWTHTFEHHAMRKGLFDEEELQKRTQYYLENPDAPLPERSDSDLLAFVDVAAKKGFPPRRDSDKAAAFEVGDRVTVIADNPRGHTRKPRYIRGKTGVITHAHGAFIYPDSAGNDGPDAPEHLYTVKFTNDEVWGSASAEPNGVIYIDVWEPYVELAS